MLVRRHRRQTRPPGAFALREEPIAVPVADLMLADLAATLRRLRAPEPRLLLAELISVLYQLTRDAGSRAQPGLAGRILAAAPALARRIGATVERLDALDAELDRVSDAEVVQELGRIERRLTGASDAERRALTASRRELEGALERGHKLERDHERLSSALCGLIGRLSDVGRDVEGQLTLVEEEAQALEADQRACPPVA
jgi:hypothetical protein